MAVPKRKTTRAKRDQRRAQHDRFVVPTLVDCANCGSRVRPHHVCGACGFYHGRPQQSLAGAKREARAQRRAAAGSAASG